MRYNFDEIVDRKKDPYSFSSKWVTGELMATKMLGVKNYSEDSIPLYSADMDFKCPQPVIEALKKEAEHGVFGYTLVHTSKGRYENAICRWCEKHYEWRVNPDSILYVNGALEGIMHSLRALCQPGDGVIVQRPVYGPFAQSIQRAGCVLVNNPLQEKEHGWYSMDYEDLEKKAAESKNKVLILCHPHNPVGRIWSDEELVRTAEICRRHGVAIISDEMHCDLIRHGEKFHPLAKVAGGNGVITINGVNKTFNLAGLQGANLIIEDKSLYNLVWEQVMTITPNPFTLVAMLTAYEEGEEWLEQCTAYLDANIDFTIAYLKEHLPLVHCRRPEGSYILWLDFRDSGFTQEEIHECIYEKAHVYLETGASFDPERGQMFERICVATPRSLLEEGMKRLCSAFK